MLTMLTTRLFTNSLPTIASLCLLALPSASATVITVGDMNPPSDVGPSDGWDAVFLFSTPLSAPNASEVFGTVTQFEFWAETGTTNRNITPLLFSSADAGATFSTIGVGTTYTVGTGGVAENAVNTVGFSLTAGTALFDTTAVGLTYYVGYHTTDLGGVASATGGVISFADTGGGPNTLWQTESVPTVGQNPATGSSATFSSNRQYAYNFDINYTVPEPSHSALLVLAAGGLLVLRRSRRSA